MRSAQRCRLGGKRKQGWTWLNPWQPAATLPTTAIPCCIPLLPALDCGSWPETQPAPRRPKHGRTKDHHMLTLPSTLVLCVSTVVLLVLNGCRAPCTETALQEAVPHTNDLTSTLRTVHQETPSHTNNHASILGNARQEIVSRTNSIASMFGTAHLEPPLGTNNLTSVFGPVYRSRHNAPIVYTNDVVLAYASGDGNNPGFIGYHSASSRNPTGWIHGSTVEELARSIHDRYPTSVVKYPTPPTAHGLEQMSQADELAMRAEFERLHEIAASTKAQSNP